MSHTTDHGAHATTTEHGHRHSADGGVTITEDGRVLNDPTHAVAPDHGNTPGAWAMAGLVVLGVVVGALALFLDLGMFVVWIGVALIGLVAVVGIVTAGKGKTTHDAHARSRTH